MSTQKHSTTTTPRIIIHGGAGNITRRNLPLSSYGEYRRALLSILTSAHAALCVPGATALDTATYAVSLLEDNALFNSGHGAVYTTAGRHELEASVMVSRGRRKRGVGVMNVHRTKNPIKLAREMLIRGDEEGGGGAQGHCQLQGETCDRLAREWGLEIVRPSYYWTRRRWDEHRRGLGMSHDDETYEKEKSEADEGVGEDAGVAAAAAEDEKQSRVVLDETSWNGEEYLPQGTVGAVVLDSSGTLCVATSTGGLTNKLPGRIGDTPTLGAGFWAEEWTTTNPTTATNPPRQAPPLASSITDLLFDCLPSLSSYTPLPSPPPQSVKPHARTLRAVAMSGTGNGDSFLRTTAARTTSAIARFARNHPSASGIVPLQDAVSTVAGPGGMLQQSAGDRWGKTGEGEGGVIGIDFEEGRGGDVVFDFNCGGMFRAWVDERGRSRVGVFRGEDEVVEGSM